MFGRVARAHDALARTRARVVVGACPCAASVALMERIDGLRAAAAMHRAGSLRGAHSVAEWTSHLDAEDGGPDAADGGGGLFRLMEAASERPGVPEATRRRVAMDIGVLRGDHQRWRVGLGRGIVPPGMEAAVHAAIEDRLAVDLKDGILAEAAARGILRDPPRDDARHATVAGDARVGLLDLRAVKAAVDAVPSWDTNLYGGSKFQDPWIVQGRGSPAPGGREYLDGLPLDGPAGARAHVDAMLAKIAGPAGDRVVPMEAELRAVGEILRQRIDADALKTRQAVWRGWDYLNEKTGRSFWGTAIVEGLKWVTGLFDLGSYGAGAKAHAMAAGSVDTALAQTAASIDAGVPYPWHAFEIAPVDVAKLRDKITQTKDSAADFSAAMTEIADEAGTNAEALDHLDAAARSLLYNNQRWFGNPAPRGAMPDPTRAMATAWWATLAGMLAREAAIPATDLVTPRPVTRAFRAMNGDAWGALDLASDEQVMIVAAATAAAYEVDARDLAIELWARSGGWSAERVLLAQVGGVGLADIGGTPTNAAQIQWWQLTRNAAAIAGAWRSGAVVPDFAPYDPREPRTAAPSGAGGATGVSTGAKVAIGAAVIAAAYGVYAL